MSSEQQRALSSLSPAPLTFKQATGTSKVGAGIATLQISCSHPGHPRGGRCRWFWPGPAVGWVLVGHMPGQGVQELALAAGQSLSVPSEPSVPTGGCLGIARKVETPQSMLQDRRSPAFFFPSASERLIPRRTQKNSPSTVSGSCVSPFYLSAHSFLYNQSLLFTWDRDA